MSSSSNEQQRPIVLAANWKMHKLRAEAMEWASEFGAWVEDNLTDRGDVSHLQAVVGAPYTVIELLAESNPPFGVFAQNMHQADSGAFTGEISPAMLRDIGAQGVILGHSERRQYFNETDEALAEKVQSALEFGLRPMLCVGETLQQRNAGEAKAVVTRQLRIALAELEEDAVRENMLYLAYEPVWAIGTGETATPAQAQEMHVAIRAELANLLDAELANRVPILYGGSVKPGNAPELLIEADIDGALIGGAALEVESFTGIFAAALQTHAGIAQ